MNRTSAVAVNIQPVSPGLSSSASASEGAMANIATSPVKRLNRFITTLPCTDPNDIDKFVDEDLSVTDLAGVCGL